MAVQISGNDITVPRDGSFTRNVTIGGTLTYEDVTNIDSVGLVTARNGIEIGARPGVAASISVDGNMIVSGISTFGGDVQVPDKIIHSGDTNTALRFPAADTVSIETAGSERVRITSDGDVGIGVNDPDAKLEVLEDVYVKGSSGDGSVGIQIRSGSSALSNQHQIRTGGGSGDQLFIEALGGSSAIVTKVAGSERLRIKSDGNVEIGGGTHSRRLAVHDTTNSVILIEGASNGTSNLMFGDENDEDVGMLGYNHGSNYLAFTVNAAERLRITSGGNLEVKASGADASRSIKIEGTNGSSELQQVVLESDGENGKFFINAAAGNGTPTDKFTINTITGNIGINESSPAAPLHISTPASTTCEIRLTSNNTGSGAGDRGRINVRSSRNDGSAYQAGYVDIDRSSGTEDKAHLLVALNDGSGASERIRITSSGQILIGATSNTMGGHFELTKNIGFNDCAIAIKRLNTTITSRSFMRFVDFNGNAQGSIGMGSNTVSYNTSSDYRLKENQVAISDGIARLKNLKPYRFNFKVDPDKTVDGFFAHEVTPIIPEAVTGEKDAEDMQQLDYAKLTPLLTAALQEAVTEIESLKARLDAAGL
jgi:hypothetical protein